MCRRRGAAWMEDGEDTARMAGGEDVFARRPRPNISYVVKPPSGMALPHRQLGCENSGETVSLSF